MVRHRAGRHPGPMMIRVLTFVSLFLCLGWTASVRAADPPALQLDGDRGIFWVHAAPAAMAFREAGCCIDLDRALALDAWAPVAGDMIPTAALPVPGTDAGPVWVRFDVQNVMTRDGRWLIDTRAMRFRQISVTLLRDTGTAEVPERPAALSAYALPAEVAEFERREIREALEQSNGNVTAAARRLRIPRGTLRHKLRRYELHGLQCSEAPGNPTSARVALR